MGLPRNREKESFNPLVYHFWDQQSCVRSMSNGNPQRELLTLPAE